jgi:hypothetical protein
MPLNSPCPKCGKLGLIRMEHVIQGGRAMQVFYCGGCEYSWTSGDQIHAATPDLPHQAMPKARTREFGPKTKKT